MHLMVRPDRFGFPDCFLCGLRSPDRFLFGLPQGQAEEL
jgi:hypothetical protein